MPSQVPLVSVVMPVYDPHPAHFRQAVQSILRQTLGDLELIIVEDPSLRPAAALVAEFNDPRVRHVIRPVRGTLVESLNLGLAEARAAWVARADADDVCEPDRLEKQVAYLQEHPELDVLGSQLTIIDGAGNVEGCRDYPRRHEAIARGLTRANTLAHPSVMFRKERVLAAGGYRAFFNEDYELWSRLARNGARFGNHSEALVRYRVIVEGVRAAKVQAALRGTLEVKRLHWRDEMDFGGKLRMGAEWLLLWVPARVVLALFRKTQFRRLPSARTGRQKRAAAQTSLEKAPVPL